MWIDKTGRAMKRLDFVDSQLLFSAPPFLGRDVFLVAHEIGNGRLLAEREIHAEELARAYSRQGQCALTQRLTRNRAGVDPGATDLAKFFHQRDALAKNPRRIRPGDSCRTAADHYQVKVLSHKHRFSCLNWLYRQ